MSQVQCSRLGVLKMIVKQIIHIELCEAEFKRRKVELEKGKDTLDRLSFSSQTERIRPKGRWKQRTR